MTGADTDKFVDEVSAAVVEFAKAARAFSDADIERLPAEVPPVIRAKLTQFFDEYGGSLDGAADGVLEIAAKLFLEIGRVQQPADIARILRSLKSEAKDKPKD